MLGEWFLKLLAVVVAGSLGAAGKDVTDEEYARFPKLFHLDDFETCLLQADGVYCLGTFYIKPINDPDPTYELMKEYSSDPNNFNRSLLHRGYCISSRCPTLMQHNASVRFERCASLMARRRGLRASLTQLSYCRSHAQDVVLKDLSTSIETPHRVFLYVVGAIVAFNILGTTYDVMSKSGGKKSKLLTSWSLVSNWSQLMCPYPDGDPRLAALLPVEAFRVIMIQVVVFVHAGIIHNMLFIQNTKFLDQMSHHPVTMLLQNGSSIIQMFILLSNFLLAHSLLSMEQPPSFSIIPQLVLKRIFRITPVYLLVISFAATWWPLTRDGPMWPLLVGAESDVCRRKFWPHVFFVQNFVEPERHCQLQTWFLAVDMQLYVVGVIVTLCLARARRLALPLLGTAFIASCVLNAWRGYVNEWQPLMFISVPENIRTMFRHAPSFSEFHTGPMGSLPTSLLGLFMAHLHHYLQDTGFKAADHTWLIIACQMTVPLFPAWTSSGHLYRHFTSRMFKALFLALERPVIAVLAAALLFGVYNGTGKKDIVRKKSNYAANQSKGFLNHIFSWRGWYPLGRMTLTVMMLHWCVNSMIVASRLTPITSTTLDMVADWLATSFLAYLLAVPITLMVELPFQKFYSAIISQANKSPAHCHCSLPLSIV